MKWPTVNESGQSWDTAHPRDAGSDNWARRSIFGCSLDCAQFCALSSSKLVAIGSRPETRGSPLLVREINAIARLRIP